MYISIRGVRHPGPLVRSLACLLLLAVVYLLWSSPPYLQQVDSTSISASHADLKKELLARVAARAPLNIVSFNCTPLAPNILPSHTYGGVELFFFGKPTMEVLKSICIEKRWKWRVFADGKSTAALKQQISPDSLTIIQTTSLAFEHEFIRNQTHSQTTLITSIPKAYQITGGKNKQLLAYRHFASSHGCTLDGLGIMPNSYLLDDPQDCINFFLHLGKKRRGLWIVKPYGGYGGNGIKIYKSPAVLVEKFAGCKTKETSRYILQDYLPNLLLLNGRKFDVRAYVLIARTNPYFLFYHDGYLRVALQQFSDQLDRDIHLTNTHVQSAIEGFTQKEHLWTFDNLQHYINNISSSNDNFVSEKLRPFIKQIGQFLLHSGTGTFERLPSIYLLIGIDFMVTADYRVWFIEANNYPLWPRVDGKLGEQMHKMATDMFELEMEIHSSPDKFTVMRPGDSYASWELIYSEYSARCQGDQPFNPCKDIRTSSTELT